jgi:hypothetical protein
MSRTLQEALFRKCENSSGASCLRISTSVASYSGKTWSSYDAKTCIYDASFDFVNAAEQWNIEHASVIVWFPT